MSLAVVGSVAFDSVSSPFGSVERELGGSATYAALAAAFFTDVRVVAPVGDDFGAEHYQTFERAGVDTGGVQAVPRSRTFFWRGRYEFDMSVAHTEETQLNAFDGWRPRLSREAGKSDILFLAAMDPEIQIDVRRQWQGGKWVALDSIDYWIKSKREALIEAVRGVDVVLMNDQEARALTRKPMLLRAAREIASWGPRAVVLKLGEYGCALLSADGYFSLPGYPLEDAADPTGTGDAFAGGFLGYLDRVPNAQLTAEVLHRAVTYGSVMASFCVEDFGARRITRLTDHEVDYRSGDFKRMTHFEHVPTRPRPHEPHEEPEGRRLERPHATPTTGGYDAPARTAGTPTYDSPPRTPSTETLHGPTRPLPREDA